MGFLRPSAAAAVLLFASTAHAQKDLGLNVHQSTTVGMDVAKGTGVKWVRIDVNWLDVEKAEGQLDFTLMDAIVDAAAARGSKVLAVLAYTPAWASTGDVKKDGSTNDVPKAGKYEAFVSAAVKHFGAKVSHYELWNEPNLETFWEGTADDYVQRVLVPGSMAVHTACGSCKVVAPGLATVGGTYDVFFDTVLTAAKDDIDVVSGHAYASFADIDPEAGTAKDSFLNKVEAHRILKVGGSVIYEGPLAFKETMDKHGITKPFWITEAGYEAAPGDAKAEAKQVLQYRHVIESMLLRSWWTTTIFYEAFDEPPAPYTWGVVVHDGSGAMGFSKKPVYDFLAGVTSSQPALGGTKTDCSDGLDNDLDGMIDYPADPGCASASAAAEGPVAAGAGGVGGGGSSGAGAGGTGGAPGGNAGAVGAGASGAGGAADDSSSSSGRGGGGCAVGAWQSRGGGVAMSLVLLAACRRRRGTRA